MPVQTANLRMGASQWTPCIPLVKSYAELFKELASHHREPK
ncbi:hypothetical protein AK812_SmicGene48430, partial [Symbiodinium microadriaticum]